MPTIVFVCYGNICRSPFAEHLARNLAKSAGLATFFFASAGVGATSGTPCPKHAVQAARRFEVDLATHRAQRIQSMDPGESDLLIAMDRHVFGQLAQDLSGRLHEVRGPGGASLRLMLKELDPHSETGLTSLDVPDPMGMGLDAYLASYELISSAVGRLIARLA